jgi:hypothetical protein
MRPNLRRSTYTLLLLSILPLAAVGQDRSDLDREKDERKEMEKMVRLGEVSGILTKLGGDRTLTLKVTLRYLEPNASAFQNRQNLLRRQMEIMRNRNPLERQRQMAQLANDIAKNELNLYKPKEVQKDLEVVATEKVKVRSLQPPLAFDDKGNPRKYTQQELRDLKGEGHLPGYMSDYDSLRTGQAVTVRVAQKKSAGGGRILERKLLETDKPYATMIVIVSEPAPQP